MTQPESQSLTTDVPMKFRRRGGKTVMVLPDGSRAIERKDAIVDSAMVKLVARGYRWHRLLADGVHNTIEEVAAAEKISDSYVSRAMRLAFLAPVILEAILDGKQPAHLTMKDLLEPFPFEWGRQMQHFFGSS